MPCVLNRIISLIAAAWAAYPTGVWYIPLVLRFYLQRMADRHTTALDDAQAASFQDVLGLFAFITLHLWPWPWSVLSSEQGWLGASQALVSMGCAVPAVGCLGVSVGLNTSRKVVSLRAAKWHCQRIKCFGTEALYTYWWENLFLFFSEVHIESCEALLFPWPLQQSTSLVVHNNFFGILLIMIKCCCFTQVFQMWPGCVFLLFNVVWLCYHQNNI